MPFSFIRNNVLIVFVSSVAPYFTAVKLLKTIFRKHPQPALRTVDASIRVGYPYVRRKEGYHEQAG